MPRNCYCETCAQVQVHIECVIPDEYQKFELNDFTGVVKDGKRVIKPTIVSEARNQLISYCWEGIGDGEEYDFKTWWDRSIMEKRRRNGNSIIIYGNPWASGITGSGVRTFKQALGRTMLAAIVMKEAIRMRARPNHMADSYAWVSYTKLYDRLMSHATSGDYADEVSTYQSADWLCVDGFEIEKQNEATRQFKAKVLDLFFDERMNAGLPNILVFQDDISQEMLDLRSEFGLSVNSLISSSKTTRVKLLETKDGK